MPYDIHRRLSFGMSRKLRRSRSKASVFLPSAQRADASLRTVADPPLSSSPDRRPESDFAGAEGSLGAMACPSEYRIRQILRRAAENDLLMCAVLQSHVLDGQLSSCLRLAIAQISAAMET
ncbi:hypothetical protein GCM10022261_08950 [Brevibacterium daeguense]|uniref:Spo0E like sporulation regulatory protein n=1 Tax=Brevibacterium daeguense TaxID=909936 RepID=A0ABP8EHC3_9MICO